MDSRESALHIGEALIRASAHPLHPEPEKPTPFTIAFSREAGSGGLLVAREVGKRLNWPVYDQELLEQLAKEMQVHVDLLKNVDERKGSWLVDCLNAFAAVSTVTEVTYFRRMIDLILTLGDRGECVIVGRGSSFVLPAESTLCVRLLASRKDRIALMCREYGLNPTEAARFVDTTDKERLHFIKDHFHKDPTDSQNYDLVLNTSRFSVEECADLIVAALHHLQARTEPTHQTAASS